MNSFADQLRGWLSEAERPCAQRAERAQPPMEEGSARCARSAHGSELSQEDLPVGWDSWPEDAQVRFVERLGVGEDLGLPTDRGTPAWEIARCEAAVMAGAATPQTEGDRLAAVFSLTLGVRMTAHVQQLRSRFEDEADWDNNPLYPSGRRSAAEVARDDGGADACRMCRRRRRWRLPGQRKWTCGACHPPAPGLDVEWLETRPAAAANTEETTPQEPSNQDLLGLEWLGLDRPTAEEGS